MKRKNLFFALAAGMMLLTACNNEFEPVGGGELAETHEVELNFDFTVSSGTQTRAGRDLWSEEALQQVNNLHLYIFRDEKFVKDIAVGDFDNSHAIGDESHTYKFNPHLAAGEYKFLAVGFEEKNQATYTLPTLTENTTTLNEMTIALAKKTAGVEVFAGISDTYNIGSNTNSLTASVELYRAVAGVLGYFKNIPYQVTYNDEIRTVTRLAVEVAHSGTEATLSDRKVKSQDNEKWDLFSWDMTTGFGIDTDNNRYTCAAITGAGKAYTKQANSVVAGKFLLPFDVQDGVTSTFKVVLYAEDDAVKTYKVVCKGNGKNDAGHTESVFDILANHYYGLGHKLYANNDDPNNPKPDPNDPDPDEPIDLSKDEVIVITVKANWDVVHHLGLGEEE